MSPCLRVLEFYVDVLAEEEEQEAAKAHKFMARRSDNPYALAQVLEKGDRNLGWNATLLLITPPLLANCASNLHEIAIASCELLLERTHNPQYRKLTMKPATEQLLATLELLTDDLRFKVPRETSVSHYITPFSWDIEAQGELNALSLLKFKGVVQLTDVEVAISNWQAIEQQGTPTEDGYYAPERDERENFLDEATQAKRIAAYQSLLQLLKSELQELQAFSFSCSQSFNEHDEGYTSYALVGRTQDNDWICLASTVPEQTSLEEQEISRSSDTEIFASKPLEVHTSAIVSRIEEILTELPPVEIYGYYEGGYDYTYEHEIIYKAAAIRELAFENAANLVEIDGFKGFYLDSDYFCKEIHHHYEAMEEDIELDQLYQRYQKLNQFLTQNLSNLVVYRFIFWDWDYIYVLGQSQAGDWLGVETTNEFVYNP